MNLALHASATFAPATALAPSRVALLGTGTVGTAVLARLASREGTPLGERLQLVHVANSRTGCFPSPPGRDRCSASLPTLAPEPRGLSLTPPSAPRTVPPSPAARARDIGGSPSATGSWVGWGEGTGEAWCRYVPRTLTPTPLPKGEGLDLIAPALHGDGISIVIDATASDAVAERHAHWLAQGIHVVTACKLGQGASLARFRAIHAASAHSGARYGDAATVGAGLPLLRSIRALRAGGDEIHAIAGVLSGSLGWLFSNYDGTRAFSALVRQARDAGYTEPDPRDDLSGADVQRKLLILARAAGYALDADQIEVESLVPAELAALPRDAAIDALHRLDAPLRERYRVAQRDGRCLRFVARFEAGRARVGLETLAADDPLAQGGGCDNRVVIHSDRYRERPLVIQGPGAGAEVTAAALLDDVLDIAAR